MSLLNYEGHNVYINLTYNKKNDSYKLRWFNLSQIIDLNIDKYMSCTYIPHTVINMIENDFLNFNVSSIYEDELIGNNDVVCLKANIKTAIDNEINVRFKRYLPKSLGHLFNLFVFIFRNMPKKFEAFLYETMAQLTDTTEKYEYKKRI